MTFAHPLYFLLLLLLPLILAYRWWTNKRPATFILSTVGAFRGRTPSLRVRLSFLPSLFLALSYVAMVFALARPQTALSHSSSTTEGIHIMLTLDLSTSMLAEDLKPNRIEAAKAVASEFVQKRPNDNIGLVVFARESFTQCPMTTDQGTLLRLLGGVETGVVTDGTAIGNGLATAIGRLKDVEGKSKVIILLTDGSNNAGEIAPLTAAELAETFGIRVYTIGVGTQGVAPYPFQTPMGVQYQNIPVDIDETTLKAIAEKTGGKYFRAVDNESLSAIYDEIDKLEKVKLNVETYTEKTEYFGWFVAFAALSLCMALIGRMTIFRILP